jgi:outer membrane protein assembly factor BamA
VFDAAVLVACLVAAPMQAAQLQTTGPQAPVREVVVEVRVHGNQIVAGDEVLEIAGVRIGIPFTETLLEEAAKRLKDSGKFETIEVVKRFASIEDASRILVMIIVSEGPVRIVAGGAGGVPQVRKRSFLGNLMFAPVLEGQDGYGLTYGARVAYPHLLGRNSRISFPLTWGGTRRAGVELDRTFSRGPFTRVEVGGGIQRRHNPAYDEDDDRVYVSARGQRTMGPVRAGVTGGWQRVEFGALDEEFRSLGGDITLDTRVDPVLPRNALLVTGSAERILFRTGVPVTKMAVDARGYIGLFGQHVLVLHAVREDASGPLPPYLRSILGGWTTLRGFETGVASGDTLVAGSIEWRAPLTSPLRFGKLGVTAFVDWGAAYDHGQTLEANPLRRGAGGSVWFTVASFRLSMAVAHGRGAGVRVHFSGGVGF